MLPKLEKAFGGWKNAGPVPALDSRSRRSMPRADLPGGQARRRAVADPHRLGRRRRRTPDYYPLDVLNTVLGGSFSSRLNMNLREEHGYAYGAGSSFDMRQSAGPFVASAGVQSDKTVESLQEIFKELDGMRQPIPADELAKAKNFEALGFPAEFETTAGMAGNLIQLVIYGLPESFFTEYVPKILAVTPADVDRAANQYISPTGSPSSSSATSRRSRSRSARRTSVRCAWSRSTRC